MQGNEGQGKARQGKTRQGKAGGKARQDRARPGKTMQGKGRGKEREPIAILIDAVGARVFSAVAVNVAITVLSLWLSGQSPVML